MSAVRLDFLPGVVHADVVLKNFEKLALEFDEAHRLYPYVDRFFLWVAPTPVEETVFYFPEERRFGPAPELLRRFPRCTAGPSPPA